MFLTQFELLDANTLKTLFFNQERISFQMGAISSVTKVEDLSGFQQMRHKVPFYS
jgi:hypothetical protein